VVFLANLSKAHILVTVEINDFMLKLTAFANVLSKKKLLTIVVMFSWLFAYAGIY